MALTATKQLLDLLRSNNWQAEVVERWVKAPNLKSSGNGFRRDLFNLFDIIAFNPFTPEIAGFQTTSQAALAKHLAKYEEPENVRKIKGWLSSGGSFYVVAFQKATKRIPKRVFVVSYHLSGSRKILTTEHLTFQHPDIPIFERGITAHSA